MFWNCSSISTIICMSPAHCWQQLATNTDFMKIQDAQRVGRAMGALTLTKAHVIGLSAVSDNESELSSCELSRKAEGRNPSSTRPQAINRRPPVRYERKAESCSTELPSRASFLNVQEPRKNAWAAVVVQHLSDCSKRHVYTLWAKCFIWRRIAFEPSVSLSNGMASRNDVSDAQTFI
jgi:hypothetical protein